MYPLVNVGTENNPVMLPVRFIRVVFWNGHSYTTGINGTEISIQRYFVDQWLNLGYGWKDDMKKVKMVQFLDAEPSDVSVAI